MSVQAIRGLVRPFLTCWFAVTWTITVIMVITEGGSIADIPWEYTTLTWGTTIWWFGDRTFFKRFDVNVTKKE